MSTRLVLIVLGALAAPHAASAALTCANRSPVSINAPSVGSLKCQDTIAKAGAKFLKTKLKVAAKCRLKQPAGSCPTADDTAKITKAAAAASTKIGKNCGDDSVQTGLSSSYKNSADETVIGSCMLSQHNVVADLILAESHGPTTEAFPGTAGERADCVKEISKQGTKFFLGALKAAGKCLSGQSKLGTSGNLSPICLGSFSGGTFVPPTDPKTAQAQTKLLGKTDDAIAKKCGPTDALGQIGSIFACPGSATVADLQKCLECGGVNGLFDVAEQQYAERGTYVANGPANAIQTAVSAASNGDKLLIGSGTYVEEVNVTTPNLSIVGCGGASDHRPLISRPATQVTGNGFQASSVDGLLFQSLNFFDQAANHIFVAQANGATFRDITGDGNRHTRYAVFPVRSNNVLIELSRVVNQADAPLYVGQSSTIVVRYNDVRKGVSGIEIENSGNAQVYGNYGAGNTAGLLVFKDGSLPVQLAQCHSVHHNLFENNNEPNFGVGSVAGVPTGTGILVLSADTTPYSYNICRGNNTGGFIMTDQHLAGFGPPFSADAIVDGNYVFNNVLQNNGSSPDPVNWPLPAGYDLFFIVDTVAGVLQASGNCQSGNVFTTSLEIFGTPPNLGTCTLPPPAVFPGCPAPPIGASTTTTSTTSTTTTTVSSPSGAFLDGSRPV